MFGESILWWLKNNRSAVHSIRANVLTKEMNGHKYYICFGLEDGQMKRFPVDYYAVERHFKCKLILQII